MACLVDPSKTDNTIDCVRWSEILETIRKDVEVFFGYLKSAGVSCSVLSKRTHGKPLRLHLKVAACCTTLF